MPCDYKQYPPDWKQIRAAILERAGHKCEECGVENYAVGARDRNGVWHDENNIHHMNSDYGDSLFGFGKFPKMVKIVLTVAHLDHDINNNNPANLKALCQLHHLRHDAKQHAANAAITRKRKTGQMELFVS